MKPQIRVVVVDDSAFMRQLIAECLTNDGEITVVGMARDPYQARELIKASNPDVVTLDVEMPRMDGLAFLEKIMTLRPMPVVMVSTITKEGSDATVRALELGAVDYVTKPEVSDPSGLAVFQSELVSKVKLAREARVRALVPRAKPVAAPHRPSAAGALIAIGASTGGVERIRDVLAALPAECPPIVIVQHMGASYLASFAARLDTLSALSVRLGQPGDRLLGGTVTISPGDRHLFVERDGAGYRVKLLDLPPVSGHRPSVDVLFESVARAAGPAGVGAILSGMGRDGAAGLLAMRTAGAYTMGEQEASCVVYGMPRAAKEAGAVVTELPLWKIPGELLRAAAVRAEG